MLPSNSPKTNETREKIASFGPKGLFLLDCIDRGFWLLRLRRVIWKDGVACCTCDAGEDCPGPGKHPRDLVRSPLDPRDPRTLGVVLARLRHDPACGWGVHLGLSGLVALDIDTKNDGLANWAALQAALQLDELQPFTVSGSGGPHYLFKAPGNCDERSGWKGPNGETSCSVPFAGVGDFKTGQGFVVLPFSPHKAGGEYTRGPSDVYAELPAAITAVVNAYRKFTGERPRSPATGTRSEFHEPVTADERDRRIAAFVAACKPAVDVDGGGKRTLGLAHALVVGFECSRDEAFRWMKPWNESCSPPWSDAELWHKIDDAPKLGGTPGYLLNAEYVRQPGPDETWAAGKRLTFTSNLSRTIVNCRNGDIAREYIHERKHLEIDLSDLAGMLPLKPHELRPWHEGYVPLPAVDLLPPPIAADPWTHPESGKVFSSVMHYWGSRKTPGIDKSQRCESGRKVVRHMKESFDALGNPYMQSRVGIVRPHCNGVDCPRCMDLKRQHIGRSFELHTCRLKVVHTRVVRLVDYPSVYASIKAAGGEYLGLLLEDGRRLVVSDKPFDGSTQHERGAYFRPFAYALCHMRIDGGRRYVSSAAWKLIDDSKHECKAFAELDGPASHGDAFERFIEACGKALAGSGEPGNTSHGSRWYFMEYQEAMVLLWRWELETPGPLQQPPEAFWTWMERRLNKSSCTPGTFMQELSDVVNYHRDADTMVC